MSKIHLLAKSAFTRLGFRTALNKVLCEFVELADVESSKSVLMSLQKGAILVTNDPIPIVSWLKNNGEKDIHPKIIGVGRLPDTQIAQLLRQGVHAYIHQNDPVTCLVQAIEAVVRDEGYLSPTYNRVVGLILSNRESVGIETLSATELEIFARLGQGEGTKHIAQRLGRSVKTIESHRARIKTKLKLGSGRELVHAAIQHTQSTSSE
jgi:DNA-binding NarL/FixJ family response regulator